MTTPETEAAITAAAADAWQAAQTATCPHHLYVICDDCWMTAAITAALPHIIQALANDAYQSRGLAACTAGDWLTERHADLLAPLDET